MYRKSFTRLNVDELTKFANALNALSADTINGLVQEHENSFSRIHGNNAFLPWHRWFIRKFEQALQAEDSDVYLPYWDWTRSDSRDLDRGVWSTFFGGRSVTGGQVRGNWGPRRDPTTSRTLPTRSQVVEHLRISTFGSFWDTIERSNHNGVHRWVGGHIATASSPRDPLFYLLHCNVDRLWVIWQQNNADKTQFPSAAEDTPMAGGATPNSMLNHRDLNYRYERDIQLEILWNQLGHGILSTGDDRDADLYIRDSISDVGDHPSPTNHWTSPDIWVRNNEPDNGVSNTVDDHEKPIVDQHNFIYVNVHNRGTERANNVSVEVFRCDPGTGMLWQRDFESVGKISISGLDAHQNEVVGPFRWRPTKPQHDCLLAIVESEDNPAETRSIEGDIPHNHIVRFDNNVGQRNVAPIKVATNGNVRAIMHVAGGLMSSTNAFVIDAQEITRSSSLTIRVANGLLRDTETSNCVVEDQNNAFTTLRVNGGQTATIEGIQLAAREHKMVQVEFECSQWSRHEHRYPLVATQIEDGQVAGRQTFEFVAIKDTTRYFLGNRNSKELHKGDCRYARKMHDRNKVPFSNVEEALAEGYEGCFYCLLDYHTD